MNTPRSFLSKKARKKKKFLKFVLVKKLAKIKKFLIYEPDLDLH